MAVEDSGMETPSDERYGIGMPLGEHGDAKK